ncbi:MAG: hypothetical protein KDE59_18375, partial [Anaerolineales bacterium]|nr:hypothetical protein [Anaerolineales bacterium]
LWPDVRGLDIYALELDDFPEPTCCLLALWGLHWEAGWDTAEELWTTTGRYANLDLKEVRPDQLSAALPAILDQLLTRPLAGPLAALPTLLQLIFKETGNLFLDFGPDELAESGLTFSWREETVLALQADWREAAPRLAALEALEHWVATDARALQRIFDLLLAAWAATQGSGAGPCQLPLIPDSRQQKKGQESS